MIDTAGTLPSTAGRGSVRERDLTAQIVEVIDARHADARLNVDEIARALYVSRRQLYRYATGGGIAAMLDERRVVAACELLVSRPHLPIAEVAEQSGFGTASRMRAQFSVRVGQSPAQFRKRALDEIACFVRTMDGEDSGDTRVAPHIGAPRG